MSTFLALQVPSRLQQSLLAWKNSRGVPKTSTSSCHEASCGILKTVDSVSFPPVVGPKVYLKAIKQRCLSFQPKIPSTRRLSQLRSSSQISSHHSASMNIRTSPREMRLRNNSWPHPAPERESDSILSFHTPWYHLKPNEETIRGEPLPLPC